MIAIAEDLCLTILTMWFYSTGHTRLGMTAFVFLLVNITSTYVAIPSRRTT